MPSAMRPKQSKATAVISNGDNNTPESRGIGQYKKNANGSILHFFRKLDAQTPVHKSVVSDLFVEERSRLGQGQREIGENKSHQLETLGTYGDDTNSPLYLHYDDDQPGLFKKRKLHHNLTQSPTHEHGQQKDMARRARGTSGGSPSQSLDQDINGLGMRKQGPFVVDSESDDDCTRDTTDKEHLIAQVHTYPDHQVAIGETKFKDPSSSGESEPIASVVDREGMGLEKASVPEERCLAQNDQATSMLDVTCSSEHGLDEAHFEDFEGFETLGDVDEEYEEGEELVERRWMDEHARLESTTAEAREDREHPLRGQSPLAQLNHSDQDNPPSEQSVTTCPVCSIEFGRTSDRDVSIHVNNCLDVESASHNGQLTKVVQRSETSTPTAVAKLPWPNRPAKPGQQIPFNLSGQGKRENSSAFSAIMSTHTEEDAWASAAAAEHAARGKPAYQRTCPFYKILPGFFICVDAFRYGAVKGCQAYFLSHFHSDHYVGLTSTWCHGPIYCSRVTANLVKQQLRVEAKWVIDLGWDEEIEVPGTDGVCVTMIPANHCPGSSLFLFEKPVGKGSNPKKQRVLHCGDFRACPGHVEHPLLRPDVLNVATGKYAQQRIDVCYLDTTYLNPRYAFPSQEDVIRACADMCVSLDKASLDENDRWEPTQKERAGAGFAQFVRTDSAAREGNVEEKHITELTSKV